jgi:hypothetical protein
MISFEPTPELLDTARSVIWFQEPQDTLANPVKFLAYAMTYGAPGDLLALQNAGVTAKEYTEVLENAPPGVFDPRSWAYWNLKCGRAEVPPMPIRHFD